MSEYGCRQYHQPYRPEAEGRLVLPWHEYGMDVIALIGALRYAEHRSVPEIHHSLRCRGVDISQRNATNLLDRYDEVLSLSLGDDRRLQEITGVQKRVILAIDGLQPDVGHEVLWVLRDCLSSEVLLARPPLSSTAKDLAKLISTVRDALRVPIEGVVSDGQESLRNAVRQALPDVPHQLCHFHGLREAARPIYKVDRHAKKGLKKRVRGARPIEREVEDRSDPQSQVAVEYCAAVRSALTDDGRPPLEASGLKLRMRLSQVAASLQHMAEKGLFGKPPERLRKILQRGLEQMAVLWQDIEVAFGWVHDAARIPGNDEGQDSRGVRRRLSGLLGAMTRHGDLAGDLAEGVSTSATSCGATGPGCYTPTTSRICPEPTMT